MIKARLSAVLILLTLPAAVFLQATLLANSLPGQVTPNLGFLLTVAAGFLWGAAGGAGAGMWGGALTGASAGSLAFPYSLLYGLVGWLAGLHAEREPYRWTLPLVSLCLAVILLSAESCLSLGLGGGQLSVAGKLAVIGWSGAGGLLFLGLKPGRKTTEKSD
jgi:hypothetical protein